MFTSRVVRNAAVVMLVVTLSSCARMAWWRSEASSPVVQDKEVAASAEVPSRPSESDRESALRASVQTYMEQNSGDENRLLRYRPYFYKEYSVYPESAESADVSITETDTRLRPYLATVKLQKVRYATRLHRERGEAQSDSNFLRDTGVETLSYEYRGEQWHKVGSLFVAEKTEELVAGEWQALEEKPQRTVAAEEEQAQGWFSRIWNGVTGRY